MATLYEISDLLLSCIRTEEGDGINTITGEIIDTDALDALEMERSKKIEQIALWIKNLLSDAKASREEEKALADIRHAAERKAESLTQYLALCLNGEKFSTPRCKISYRTSTAVALEDPVKALEWCKEHAESAIKYADPTLDKTALRDLLKAGVEIDGAALETRSNLQIK